MTITVVKLFLYAALLYTTVAATAEGEGQLNAIGHYPEQRIGIYNIHFADASVKLLITGQALECYVCSNQENNKEKCVTTIKTCEQGEDACLTEVSWRTMPYWQRGGDKQFYISKRCATRSVCEKSRKRAMPYCTHIWYEDWRCSECCLGDRCNYYIILGGSTARGNLMLVLFSAVAAFGIGYFLKYW